MEPDPAPAGGSVTITVTGAGPWFVVVDRTGEVREMEVDAQGAVTMPVPVPGGETFTVTDFGTPVPTEATVPVQGSNS